MATTTEKPTAAKRSRRAGVPKVKDEAHTRTVVDELAPRARLLQEVPLELIDPHPANPRKDLGDLTELAASITEQGLIQAITLVPVEGGRYRPVAGHRRCAAAKVAGLETVPAIIRDGMTESVQLEVMLVENLHRSDLTAFEEGAGMQGLLDLGKTKADLHVRTGRARTTIDHRLQLVGLGPVVEQRVTEHALTLEQAYALANIRDTNKEVYEELSISLEQGTLSSWSIDQAKRKVEGLAKADRIRADLKAEGVEITRVKPSEWDLTEKTIALKAIGIKPAAHKTCPGHCVYVHTDQWSGVTTATAACYLASKYHAEEIKAAKSSPGLSAKEREEKERRAALTAELAAADDRRYSWIHAMLSTIGSDEAPKRADLIALAIDIASAGQTTLQPDLDPEVLGEDPKWPTDPAANLAARVLLSSGEIPTQAYNYEYALTPYGKPTRVLTVAILIVLEAAGYELTPIEISMREAFSTAPAVNEGGEEA